jgi:hypothetical protein
MSSFKDCRPTISRSPRVPCGNRTRLSGLEDRCFRRRALGTRNAVKAHRSTVFETAVGRPSASPSRELRRQESNLQSSP